MTPVPDVIARGRYAPSIDREPDRFVGRTRELARIAAWTRGASRAMAVLGPAGIGKTRLVTRFVLDRADRNELRDDAILCDLRAARDVDAASMGIARKLGIAHAWPMNASDAAAGVGRALASRGPLLLVLDNMDAVLSLASHTVTEWLAAAPALRVLVTAREPLGLGSEELSLDPLEVPSHDATDVRCDAVDLFTERVRSIRGEFEPDPDELRAIGALVRRLGGLPLAIEMAASGAARLGPGELLGYLGRDKDLRLGPARSRAGKSAASYNAIDSSWAMLQPWERAVLSQCSVFRGSFDDASAQNVAMLPAGDDVPTVVDVLHSLLAKSLLHTTRSAESQTERYVMYEGIRSFAADKLAYSGEYTDVMTRCAHFMVRVVDPLLAARAFDDLARERARVEAYRGSLETVLEFAANARLTTTALKCAIAIDVLGGGNALSRSLLRSLDAALADETADVDASLRARGLAVRAAALRAIGRLQEAAADGERALSSAVSAGDLALEAVVRAGLGEARFGLGLHGAALEHYGRTLEIRRALADRAGEAHMLQQLGAVYQTLGRDPDALTHYDAALGIALEIGDGPAEARATMGLGSYHLEHGDYDGSLVHYLHGRAIARRLKLHRAERIVNGYLGVLHFDHDRIDIAERFLVESVRASQAVGDVRVEGVFAGVLGGVLASLDRLDEARASFDSADRLLSSNVFFLTLAKLYRAHLELAESRACAAQGDLDGAWALWKVAAQRVDAAKAPVPLDSDPQRVGPSFVERSDDGRIAIRILWRALARSRVLAGR